MNQQQLCLETLHRGVALAACSLRLEDMKQQPLNGRVRDAIEEDSDLKRARQKSRSVKIRLLHTLKGWFYLKVGFLMCRNIYTYPLSIESPCLRSYR